MPIIQPLEPKFPIGLQMSLDASPVILVNLFTLDVKDEEEFLKIWQDDALFMKCQPGFISTQLHRAIGDSVMYFNYATWESNLHFKRAFEHPDFLSKLSKYPTSVSCTPHLFQKIGVSNICTE